MQVPAKILQHLATTKDALLHLKLHNYYNCVYYRIVGNYIEGENLHSFHNFTATCENFLHEILGMGHTHLC